MDLPVRRRFQDFSRSHLIILLLTAVILALLLFLPRTAVSKKSLGQCLAKKGAVLYGVDSCVNCQNQKRLFGEDFRNVIYVNCEFNAVICQDKGITIYPVWALDNKVLLGTQPLAELAKFAGCAGTD